MTNRPSLPEVLVAAGVLLLAVGCSTGQDGRPATPTPRASSAPSDTPASSPDQPTGPAHDIADALPIETFAEVADTFPLVGGNARWILRDIDDGDLLFTNLSRSGGDQLGLTIRALDGHAEDVRIAPPVAGAGVLGADMSARYVVWMVTSSDSIGVWPWAMYAFDRATGTTTWLTESPLLAGRQPPPVPGYTGPVIMGGEVYWAQVGGRRGHERVDVYECRISDCEPRVAIQAAAFPAAADGRVYAVRSERYAGDPKEAAYHVVRWDPDSEKLTALKQPPADSDESAVPTGLAASSTHVAATYTSGRTGWVTIWTAAGATTRVNAGPRGNFTYPVATDGFVAWAEGNSGGNAGVGGYLLDTRNDRLFSLGHTAGLYGIRADGPLVSWQESRHRGARPEDIVTVVGTLPVGAS